MRSVPCRYPDCKSKTLEGRDICPKHRSRERRGIFTDEDLVYGRGYIRDEYGRKLCRDCQQWLPESAYMKWGNGDKRDGLAPMCRKCKAETEKWAKRAQKYGLSKDRLIEILEEQSWLCTICTDDLKINRFVVDHDHTCCPGVRSCGNCIRGVICQRCNAGLGMFRDSVHNIRKAADYLEAFKASMN